ncbi:Acg family FMN-binding oxidoreductase [Sphaerisporangium corydalis]|uniref:Acg family FMN-binding oxidoreductase n=1 Tax=Sphaerisporangium corydalis TaxID=1441875 RepID=A0ABV9EMY5_9ACTN|nr:nitroreductase family protein [Sphaerisporangium corydalis]
MSMRKSEVALAMNGAVEAAVWAPSVHNTQPWSFALSGEEISLRGDPDRRLRLADESGRQMTISCGAALFNLRTALGELGFEPVVRTLPDPARPLLLATVRPGAVARADEHRHALYEEIMRRRTHRAGFSGTPVPGELVQELTAQAAMEGARLTPVRSEAAVRVLAALTNAAQDVQAEDRGLSLELIRWSGPPGSARRDGVPAHGYPSEPRRTHPQHFAQRGYGWSRWSGSEDDQRMSTSTGLVAVLTTPADRPEDWLAAGQALQHVLLHASAHGVQAAFHTQALEMCELREFLRGHLLSGEHPQMIMRLGMALTETSSVRRPASEVVDRD